VMIDEVAEWKPEVKGKTLFISGGLTYDGLTRLTSLVQSPSSALHTFWTAASPSKSPDQGQSSTKLEVTQTYFESVERLLKNLRVRKRNIKTMGQVAQWFSNYARKVDRLAILNVDEEMVAYGNDVSAQLRDASMVLRGVTIQRRAAQGREMANKVGFGLTQFGGTRSRATGAMSVREIIQNIQTATTEVRQSMTKKYQVEF
jgi:hypothetical protein